MTDTAIQELQRALAGDNAAWNDLFQRFHGRLRLFVRYRLGRALAAQVDVEDIVQETWLRAVPALPAFTGETEGALLGFLTTLARHAIADVARARRAKKRFGRHVRLDRSDWSRGGLDPIAMTAGPATRAVVSEQADRIEQAFAQLPANQRRIIALRQFEQRSAREVATRLGMSEGAVHAAYRRALSAWQRAYEAPTSA